MSNHDTRLVEISLTADYESGVGQTDEPKEPGKSFLIVTSSIMVAAAIVLTIYLVAAVDELPPDVLGPLITLNGAIYFFSTMLLITLILSGRCNLCRIKGLKGTATVRPVHTEDGE